MKILVWTSRNILSEGGERTYMLAKLRALEQLGCTVGYLLSPIRRAPADNSSVLMAVSGWKLLAPHKSYRTLHSLCTVWKPDILVASGIWVSFSWKVLSRIRTELGVTISFEMQGALEEITEYKLAFGSNLASRLLFHACRRAEGALLRQCADHVEVVSSNMELYLRKTYPEFRGVATAVPCGISAAIDEASYWRNRYYWRAQLGLDSARPAAAYSGSTAGWQRLGDILEWARSWPNTQVYLFLVGEASTFPSDLPDNVRIASLPHAELVAALCAFDFGILLRRSDVTSFVAFPNKVGEYLNARLRIIVDSDNIGCICSEYDAAFVSARDVDWTSPPVERPNVDLSSIAWRNLAVRLLEGYGRARAAMSSAGETLPPAAPSRHPHDPPTCDLAP
jgi:hypothetical protein